MRASSKQELEARMGLVFSCGLTLREFERVRLGNAKPLFGHSQRSQVSGPGFFSMLDPQMKAAQSQKSP